MSKAKSSIINWEQIEARHSSGGKIVGDEHDLAVFRARSVDFDLRKAEALCKLQPTDLLQELRTRIARGALNEAETTLRLYVDANPTAADDPEWQLELCRLFAFASDWNRSAEAATNVLQLQPSTATRMTALQTRALAFFELSRFDLAERDIDQVRSLATLFPAIQAAFYVEVLAIRLLASLGETSRADRMLGLLWADDVKASRLNTDRVLTLLRAETHVARLAARPARGLALATHAVAELLGDEQYAALARLEIFAAGDLSEPLQRQLLADRARYERIDRLLREIEGGADLSASAQSLMAAPILETHAPFFSLRPAKLGLLLLERRRLLISFNPFQGQLFVKTTQPLKALLAIARKPSGLTKAELFQMLFGDQRYVPHLHDPAIHQTLSRVRRVLKADLEIEDGVVRTSHVLLAGGEE